DGVDRENGGGVSGDACSIDDALAGKGLAVKKTVDEICIVLRPQAVGAGGGKSAPGIAHYTRSQLQQVFVVAAVQRQIIDFFIAESASECGGSSFDQGNIFIHRHDFRYIYL